MKIALFLSSDGIALAHRQPAGHWAMIGESAFDVPDLAAALADLRALAVEREGEPFETLLVLPDDQILYTSLTAPTADPELTAYRIEEGLDGLTPYAVTELEYDWCMLEEDRVSIAVVARETLDEARNFAAQYGFVGAGFAAMPPMERFPAVPTFELGARAAELGFSAEGIAFGADAFGAPEPEPETVPEAENEAEGAADPASAPDMSAATEVVADPMPDITQAAEAETAQFPPTEAEPDLVPDETRPHVAAEEAIPLAADDDGPADDWDIPEPAPHPERHAETPQGGVAQETPDQPWATDFPGHDTQPIVEHAALAEALMAANASYATDGEEWAAEDAERHFDTEGDDETDAPMLSIEDPSLSGPIASIHADGAAVDEGVLGDAGPEDELLPPPPSDAVRTARERARIIRGGGPGESPRHAGDGPQIAATRGPIDAPDTARGSLVGQRNSRLGFAHPDDPVAGPPPDAELTGDGPTPTVLASPTNGTMPRLADQLKRVRSASRTRPKSSAKEASAAARPRVEINTSPALGQTGVSAERRLSPFDDPPTGPASTAAATSKVGSLAGLLGRGGLRSGTTEPKAGPGTGRGDFFRRKGKGGAAETAHAPNDVAARTTSADESFTSGLLARKAVAPAGGSFKTGLILTVILLLLLAIVAIWSAVFLPNSPVARLFGMGGEEVAGDVAPASGLAAPAVFSDAPLFGQSGTAVPSLEDEAAADGLDLAVASDVPGPETPAEAPVLLPAAAPGTPDEDEVAENALPDIDADLDLPPLPPIEQFENPSVEEAETLYSEDGIWARSPDRPDLRPFDLLNRVYTAAIDPVVLAVDAVALPDPRVNPGEVPRRFPPPPPFGAEFDLTASGLVAPTPEGVMTPDGAFVISGRPSVVALPRPGEIALPNTPALNVEEAVLGAFRPTERPGNLIESRERQLLGGLTENELGERRPAARPASPQEIAAGASLFPGVDEAIAASLETAAAGDGATEAVEVASVVTGGTALAVARSPMPRTRPANIDQIIASADRAPAEEPAAVAAEAVAAGPEIPSNSDVSRAATERDVIRLRNVNLIGVTGTASDRRALVRLSSGRFVRVSVGDRLDGGRVAAIGETTLQYVRSGRTVTLEIPG